MIYITKSTFDKKMKINGLAEMLWPGCDRISYHMIVSKTQISGVWLDTFKAWSDYHNRRVLNFGGAVYGVSALFGFPYFDKLADLNRIGMALSTMPRYPDINKELVCVGMGGRSVHIKSPFEALVTFETYLSYGGDDLDIIAEFNRPCRKPSQVCPGWILMDRGCI